MIYIKPMKTIKVVLCTFGLLMGAIFPIFANFFIIWIPERKLLFCIGCLTAGYLVGLFSFHIIKTILFKIDQYYKITLLDKLGMENIINVEKQNDLILNMQNEFKQLINNYYVLKESERKRLLKLSITDCLTSVYNHRYLYEYFETKLCEGLSMMAILFCDIDHFKQVNDTYGHIKGDLVLKEVARIIRDSTNGNEGIFRYGGEEFVILLDNYSDVEGFNTAEKIRLKIYNSNVIKSYCNFETLTISIGVSTYPYDGLNIDTLINKADKAMYHVKESGRNNCKIYNSKINMKYNLH
ncbi:GGDEF domain-containing protein [Clostridium sp.]|uniref:GGDEF domain-containing protein n=1 Tax=Clostridium sp. TaxID=1506 RepID=UPI001A56A58C|nr:GGDEF domain-containing protein [Clostridium sp.]MBK5235273.1 GGDEF domain-containing protein [Clostridium sp.]